MDSEPLTLALRDQNPYNPLTSLPGLGCYGPTWPTREKRVSGRREQVLVGPLVPIALCQIAVAPGGVAWLLLLGGKTCGLFLVAIRFGICGVSVCFGGRAPRLRGQ